MAIEIERREHERFPCETTILHDTSPPDFFHKGIMCNFSKKGLYFESNEYLLQGQEISISINKPPQRFAIRPRQNFSVKIMWYRELQGSSYQSGYGAKII
ncbi:MAG: PilZ domain-containing protein [Desulfobacterales bacterium]|jgi:hypothetical protein